MQEEWNFCGKGENGNRQKTKVDLPHKMKRKIHFLRSLERRDGILKLWRMMTVNFVTLKYRIKRGCQSFLAGVPVNGIS
jgi:hypothetical protein